MSDHQLRFWSDIHGHAEAVFQLFLETYGAERTGDAEVIKTLCMTSACFGVIAHVNGDPAGFIMLQQAEESADIIEVCVRPPVQNTGIGKQLLEQALSNARTRCLTRVLLEVAVTNQPALNLYRSAGFVLVGKRPNYYRHKTGRVDALVMERHLNKASEA